MAKRKWVSEWERERRDGRYQPLPGKRPCWLWIDQSLGGASWSPIWNQETSWIHTKRLGISLILPRQMEPLILSTPHDMYTDMYVWRRHGWMDGWMEMAPHDLLCDVMQWESITETLYIYSNFPPCPTLEIETLQSSENTGRKKARKKERKKWLFICLDLWCIHLVFPKSNTFRTIL